MFIQRRIIEGSPVAYVITLADYILRTSFSTRHHNASHYLGLSLTHTSLQYYLIT